MKLLPYRDSVGFMAWVRFDPAGPKTRWIDVSLCIRQRSESSRFPRVEILTPKANIHVLRFTRPDALDGKAVARLRDAYPVGSQEGV